MNRLTQKRMVDKMIDAYVDWREACHSVSNAYCRWGRATGPGAPAAFAWYSVALDREENAAEVYAALVQRVGHLVTIPSGRSGEQQVSWREARSG
jgi:hypothetical protein